jgi:hypothetical protein
MDLVREKLKPEGPYPDYLAVKFLSALVSEIGLIWDDAWMSEFLTLYPREAYPKVWKLLLTGVPSVSRK